MDKTQLASLWELFITFMKIGAFTFGGGYAMIPLIETEVVSRKQWISHDEMVDMIAIAEATPGVLSVNCATFVGCRRGGVLGAAAATIGVVLPSFIIISIISLFFVQFRENRWVDHAFMGIRAAVLVLIANSVIKLSKICPKSAFNLLLGGCAFLLATFTDIEVILLIILGGTLGIVYQKLRSKIKGNGGHES